MSMTCRKTYLIRLLCLLACLLATGSRSPVFSATEPIAVSEVFVSPIGYGAHGAMLDRTLTVPKMLLYALEDEYLMLERCQAVVEEYGAIEPYSSMIAVGYRNISVLRYMFGTFSLIPPENNAYMYVELPSTQAEMSELLLRAEMENLAMYVHFLSYSLPFVVKDLFERMRFSSEQELVAFLKASRNP
jgi:hypothetical protein